MLVYTIGFGSPAGEPIPEYNAQGEVIGFKRDQQGDVVLSRLDEATLQQVAAASGGQYYQASASGGELEALVAELNTLQEAELSAQLEARGIERFQIFLLAALVLIIARDLIPDRLRGAVSRKRVAMHERWSAVSGK